ncbi:cytochrome c oxidase subunit 7C, mitochondrial-like [Athalia rosae]|uniref:cytochrome c oxidase subunit 7C, mitochondrial-like n=1 Tax=Athalia rosae TaxID=37344 RepID=UPI002033D0A3|nr:cytochrome c oxidase subunit 7C, mitochondrial-like [Athalia rosae]
MLSRRLVRNFMTSAIRRSGDDNHGGVPGANLPFDIRNRYKLTAYFILYFGSGIAIPYLIVRHQLLKS